MGRRLAVALVCVGAVGAGGWWVGGTDATEARPPALAVATAHVVTTDLATTIQLDGTLGFVGPSSVFAARPGTVTALPLVGATVTRGQPLYEIDGRPVTLFYGPRPPWRSLATGVADGPDVVTLLANLAALGYGTATVPSGHFGWAAAAAVRRWQSATGQAVTGQVDLGMVAYAPGPARVASLSVGLGSPAVPGALVLTATSTTPVVSMAVPAAQAYLVGVGDSVSVTLPTGREAPGRVQQIASAATSVASPAPGADPRSGAATVEALVTLTHPEAAARFDQAQVTVHVTSQVVHAATAVPVTALVARAGGGYAVYRRVGTGRVLVPVTPGLFADTLVQVTASTLRPGDLVEVPVQ